MQQFPCSLPFNSGELGQVSHTTTLCWRLSWKTSTLSQSCGAISSVCCPWTMLERECNPVKTAQRTCYHYSGTHAKPDGLWAYHVLWACHSSQAPSILLLLPISSHCPSRSPLLLLSGLGCEHAMPLALSACWVLSSL